MIPYILMAALFLVLAIFAALESTLSGWQVLPWFTGMTWLRIHFITLGAMTQIIFGAMPFLTAIRNRLERPKVRWDIWITLNAGILLLLVGIPMIGKIPIIAGGTLVFISTVLLMVQLAAMKPAQNKAKDIGLGAQGNKFYIAGLAYFLLGIIIGTGLWNGWMEPLGVKGLAVEVHIHANNWGLLSLVFAGLIIDLYPIWTKKPFANPKTINIIFWTMTVGAFGLVFGPWFANTTLLVPGLLLHLGATILLLVNFVKPLRSEGGRCSIGLKHVLLSYFWILAPVMMAPFVLFGVGNLPAEMIEATAPQALVYGWVLQFSIAVFPYFFSRALQPNQKEHKLGGSMLTLVTMNVGGFFLWASIFIEPSRGLLSGIAYFLWTIALTSIVVELWGMIRSSLGHLEKGLGVA